MGDRLHVGGQAVVEGVMMRTPDKNAVAARRPDGSIAVMNIPYVSLTKKKPWGLPFVRGVIVLGETLYIGMKAMSWSANQAVEEEEELTKWEIVATIAFSLALALVLFKLAPLAIANFIPHTDSNNFIFNLVDGISKILILIGYIWVISLSSEVSRIFQYHAAEHKTINAYQKGEKLTLKNIRKQPKEHVSCGTSFILLVLLISILFYMVIPLHFSFWIKYGLRVLFLPAIAGVAYEVIKLANRFDKSLFFKLITYPGLMLQWITTKDPEDDMIEVAKKSLKAVI